MKEGLVTKATGNLFCVADTLGIKINCYIKGNQRIKDLKSTNPVTVGDHVLFEIEDGSQNGIIHEIKSRKNYIIRKSTNWSKQYHVIAANVDQAFLIITLKEPETNIDFIDRYLVSAEAFNIKVIMIFNKYDLYTDDLLIKLKSLKKIYSEIGYTCLETSAINGMNIEILKDMLKDKITVINGNSGVGKSKIIKYIDPSIEIKIGEISAYHKSGMHTTSYTEMYQLQSGGYIIDTPGIKAFGLIDFYKEELYHYYPEIFKISHECKFHNCSHIHEPGCAVIRELEQGRIAFSRYNSYSKLFHDKNEKYRIE